MYHNIGYKFCSSLSWLKYLCPNQISLPITIHMKTQHYNTLPDVARLKHLPNLLCQTSLHT